MKNSLAIKGAGYARQAIERTARETPSASARKALARAAQSAVANYDDAGKAEWRAYELAGCPATKS